jgi:hypothetical protein
VNIFYVVFFTFVLVEVNALGLNGMGPEAVSLYRQIPINSRDEVSHICVLNACSHFGLLEQTRFIFDQIKIKTGRIITTMVCLFDCISFTKCD